MKNLALLIAAIALCIVQLELGLRLLTIHPITRTSNTVEDEVLGYRMDPQLAEIDENGFRNPEALERADVGIIGDSHTYGNNVPFAESWPGDLARASGLSVYSFGIGGYGLLQYSALVDRAFALEPRWLLFGLHLPNDLEDVCRAIRTYGYWQRHAAELSFEPELCTRDFPRRRRFEATSWLDGMALYSALRTSILEPMEARRHVDEPQGDAGLFVVDLPGRETTFDLGHLQRRADAMDLSRAHIGIAYQLATRILANAAERCHAIGCRVGVLLLPSKAAAYADAVQALGLRAPDPYLLVVDRELRLAETLMQECPRLGITCVDALPALRDALAGSDRVYPLGIDPHPLAPGYAAYARSAEKLLRAAAEPGGRRGGGSASRPVADADG